MCFFCELPYDMCDTPGCRNLCCKFCQIIIGTRDDYDLVIKEYNAHFRDISRTKTQYGYLMCNKVRTDFTNKNRLDKIINEHKCGAKNETQFIYCVDCRVNSNAYVS